MSTQEDKAVVRRFTEGFTNQDHDVLNEVLAPDLAKEVIEQRSIYKPNKNLIAPDDLENRNEQPK